MRWLAAAILSFGLASAASASLVTVKIDADDGLRTPFVVSLSGSYAGIHENRSHHWKTVLVQSGRRRPLYVAFENPILNVGVFASIYHPVYLSDSARVRHAPHFYRPANFPNFEARSWRDVFESGQLPGRGSSNTSSAALAGHLDQFVDLYVRSMDEADRGDEVDAFLPALEELTDLARAFDAEHGSSNAVAQAKADAALRRVRAWLSMAPHDRIRVREMMDAMRWSKSLSEDLMTNYDFEQLGAFLERHQRARETRRKPRQTASWTNPENDVEYRVSLRSRPGSCASLRVTTDLTRVVDADLGGMTKRVDTMFCQRRNGAWRYGRP